MNIFGKILFMYFYLKGVVAFRSKDFALSVTLFERAQKYYNKDNKIFMQYYGQALLSINNFNESFLLLSKSYALCNESGWVVENDEEYKLTEDTLNALKYLLENYGLKPDNYTHDEHITIHYSKK